MTTHRIFNFSAGPAVLPEEVLVEARDNLLSLGSSGIGILECSHRSKDFEAIIGEAEANLRKLLGIPSGYHVLFLSGGATTQFSMVPMNLLLPGTVGDYVLTGEWSKKALLEAQRVGETHVAATTEAEQFRRIPKNEELHCSDRSAYVHTTSNNTIWGTEWHHEPDAAGRPIVCDMSSDFLSRPVDVARYGLIYAGAQKNAGPAGVTVVIVRDDLRSSGIGGTLLGLALAGDRRVAAGDHTLLDGQTLVQRSRCAVDLALERAAPLVRVARRSWAPFR